LKKGFNNYAKYSGIAIQMIATILLFTWLGKWLDTFLTIKFPLFLLLGILLGIALSLYLVFKKI
jgi:F0F1-type ATP synthase assembly protein I